MLVYREVAGAGREFEVVQWATNDQPCLVRWRGVHADEPFRPWGCNFPDVHAMDAYIKEHSFPWTHRLLPKAYRVVNPPFNLRACRGQVYQVVARTDQSVHLNVAGQTRWFYLHEVEPVVTCSRRAPL